MVRIKARAGNLGFPARSHSSANTLGKYRTAYSTTHNADSSLDRPYKCAKLPHFGTGFRNGGVLIRREYFSPAAICLLDFLAL